MRIHIPRLHNRNLALTGCLVFIMLASMSLGNASQAFAIGSTSFNAGHIIDDVIFTNSHAMSVIDIQNFLNAQMPNCDTNGTQSKSYYYDPSALAPFRLITEAHW